MVHSMTAFARRERQGDWGTLTWELRSVNHRFLEAYLRLPEDLRPLEDRVRERVREHLQRGKVDCALRFRAGTGLVPEISVNEALATQLARASRDVDGILYNPAPVSSVEILRWPGVLEQGEVDLDSVHEQVIGLLDETLSQLVESRAREGARLGQVILQRLDTMGTITASVRELLPGILQRQRERLAARLVELKSELDQTRLEQEMLILAQKMDVAEELDRLQSHIEEVRRVLAGGGAVGRRLDFLLQELNREANTLGSKSVDTETTRASVELKVLIEQMREQAQNIE